MKLNKNYKDCYVIMEDGTLTIGNDLMERSWSLEGNLPASVSLWNKKTEKEWIDKGESREIPAFMKAFALSEARPDMAIHTGVDRDLGISEEYFSVELEFDYAPAKVKWSHRIYPGAAVLRSGFRCALKSRVKAEGKESTGSGFDNLETAAGPAESKPLLDDYLDCLPLEPLHCKWKSVRFRDVTDHHNNLAATEEGVFYPREKAVLQGNLLFVEERLSRNGLILVKEGPTPLAYQGNTAYDFRIDAKNLYTCGWGFTGEELNRHGNLQSYGSAVILWAGDELEALRALREYHRLLHRFVPEKDAFVMSNTWGDRSKDGKVCEEFILKELETAKKLGVSYYQIDDGWQKGVTVNSVQAGGVWEGYHKNDPDFWTPHEQRFPGGLQPVARSAAEKGIGLALWFSPDSTDHFANWEKDAEILIQLHREYGIRSFKLDGIKIRSKKGEENLADMMGRVVAETGGKVFFNLDVTAEVRNGYYGRVQYACLFLENRYTDWRNYYPHWTLRNLWTLCRYYPSHRLQVEFLNVERNRPYYGEDPLSPASCGIEYSFAVTLFANPLAWMELTGLEAEAARCLETAVNTYRRYQPEILSGHVLPIGEEPSGTGWTGFQAITGEKTGYVLILKEYNNHSSHVYKLWQVKGERLKLEKLLGDGESAVLDVDGRGNAEWALEGRFKYCLYKYSPLENA